MTKLAGRTVLVTGASRGIGAAIALRFESAGAKLIRPTRAECDLASPDSVSSFLEQLKTPVDILVNNAGTNRLGGLKELDASMIREVLQINLETPLAFVQALCPGMQERQWGRVLNISSIWAHISKTRRITYSATKAGLEGLTRSMALELAADGVLVNALAPGFVDTDLTRKNNPPEELEAIRQTIPIQRLAFPNEIAEVALFLCSPQNSYITGQTIVADGGFLCR